MPTNLELAHYDSILGDRMGRLDDGTPKFRFMRAGDLRFPVRTGKMLEQKVGDLVNMVPEFKMEQQMYHLPPTCWCVAKWIAPPSRQEWERDNPLLDYPQNGYWFCLAPLDPSKEPNEDFAIFTANHLAWQRELGYRETYNLITAFHDKREADRRSEIEAVVKDCFVNHVPGARGGDYIAFTEPSQKPTIQ